MSDRFGGGGGRNYQGGGGGRGGNRGRGRGGDRGRGRGRGGFDNRRGGGPPRGGGRGPRGRGRGGGRPKQQVVRYADPKGASEDLKAEVYEQNMNNPQGPQQVKRWKFQGSGGWQKVESLSRGSYYFYNESTGATIDASRAPPELKNKQPTELSYQDQGSRFPNPPSKFPKSMRVVRNVVTNAYPIDSKFLEEAEVHQYLVEFDPPIPTTESLRRRRSLFGDSPQDQKRNLQILNDKFGHWEFDNHCIYAMGRKRPNNQEFDLKLSKDHRVLFLWQDVFYLNDTSIPIEQQEAMLNIFTRTKLKRAGLKRISKGWFFGGRKPAMSDAVMEPVIVRGSTQSCRVLRGFECAIHVNETLTANNEPQTSALFKADLTSKTVSEETIHEIIQRDYASRFDPTSEQFRTAVKERFESEYFVMSYSSESQRITKVEFSENERSGFVLKSTGGKISYQDYLQRQYGLHSPKREFCTLVTRNGATFLPQHARLTLRSDTIKDIYDEVLEKTNAPISERLGRVNHLVHYLNNQDEDYEAKRAQQPRDDRKEEPDESVSSGEEDEKDNRHHTRDKPKPKGRKNGNHDPRRARPPDINTRFKIQPRSLQIEAAILQYPSITFRSKERNDISFSLGSRDFKWQLTGGFLDNTMPLQRWAVLVDQRDRHSPDNIWDYYGAYCGMRRFDRNRPPIAPPEIRQVDFRAMDKYHTYVSPKDQMVLIVLPDGRDAAFGSELKARFTKVLQSARIGNKACLIQCVMQSTARNKNAMIGTFEDMMSKMGNILFRIDPMLPHKNKFIDINRTWVFGLDVSHNKDKPSVVMLSLNTRPMDGTCRFLHLVGHLNENRVEITPYEAMASMVYNAMVNAFEGPNINKRPELLPTALFLFRDGVGDNQLKELHSKEVVGLQRGLRQFRDHYDLKKWKYKVDFIVVCKSTLDRFGVAQTDRRTGNVYIDSIRDPCVLFNRITSYRLWDFVMWPYHFKKPENKIRPLRYVVIKDELKLGERGGALDLFQFVYALSYTYVYSIPFPLGGTSQPGPITYAKHYAESFSQMIFHTDRRLKDLLGNPRLVNRPQLNTESIIEADTTQLAPMQPQMQSPMQSQPRQPIQQQRMPAHSPPQSIQSQPPPQQHSKQPLQPYSQQVSPPQQSTLLREEVKNEDAGPQQQPTGKRRRRRRNKNQSQSQQ